MNIKTLVLFIVLIAYASADICPANDVIECIHALQQCHVGDMCGSYDCIACWGYYTDIMTQNEWWAEDNVYLIEETLYNCIY